MSGVWPLAIAKCSWLKQRERPISLAAVKKKKKASKQQATWCGHCASCWQSINLFWLLTVRIILSIYEEVKVKKKQSFSIPDNRNLNPERKVSQQKEWGLSNHEPSLTRQCLESAPGIAKLSRKTYWSLLFINHIFVQWFLQIIQTL